MKYLMLIAMLFVGCTTSCATKPKVDAGNPYAYSGMSEYECSVICQGYMYNGKKVVVDDTGRCWCDERTCGRKAKANERACEPCNPEKGCL